VARERSDRLRSRGEDDGERTPAGEERRAGRVRPEASGAPGTASSSARAGACSDPVAGEALPGRADHHAAAQVRRELAEIVERQRGGQGR
jgi:hypothetical protein